MLNTTLIISFYNRFDFLEKILISLKCQSYSNFEVVVAEDNNAQQTIDFINNISKQLPFNVFHVSQPDNGFRKNKILNKAVVKSNGDYLIFIDGDCLPHSDFISQHMKYAKQNQFLWGRRVMLKKKYSNRLLSNSLLQPNLFSIIFNQSSKIEEGVSSLLLNNMRKSIRNFKGCNWSIAKNDLLKINGFDEDYILATTGEDDDIEWRLKGVGMNKKSVRNLAILYHLYHTPNYNKEASKTNKAILKEKMRQNNYYCLNGIDKYFS